MGLFDKFKKEQPKAAPVQPVQHTPESDRLYEASGHRWRPASERTKNTSGLDVAWPIKFTLAEKLVNTKEIVKYSYNGGDYCSIQNVYISEEPELIRGIHSSDGKELFKITPKCKAYNDILRITQLTADRVQFSKESGDYGTYYKITINFSVIPAED